MEENVTILSKPEKNRPSMALLGFLLILFALFGGIIGGGISYLALKPQISAIECNCPMAQPVVAQNSTLAMQVEISTAITDAVEKVAPAVVTVINHLPPRRSFFGGTYEQTSSGSGAIIDSDGYIISNYHVVQDAQSLEVVLADGTQLPADLMGVDPYGDLAVIRVEGKIPIAATWGNSDLLKPGETVIAIGSPLGAFKNTITVGVVSATGRAIETDQNYQLEGLIQTDAAINQGNSGGPLVNLAGQVIGINTLIVRGSGNGGTVAEGLGFAVPSNVSRAVAEKLIETGYIARPYLGVNWGWITPQIATRFQLPVNYGVYLSEVMPDGPADQAGLQRGDILMAINGQPFDEEHPYINQLFKYEPGEVVTFDVIRDGEQIQVPVKLGQS